MESCPGEGVSTAGKEIVKERGNMKILAKIYQSIFAIAVITATASAGLMLRPSANGEGKLPVKKDIWRSGERQFSFNVQTAADGSITGQAILVDPEAEGAAPGEPYTLEVEISCMYVVGNVAFFGGMTTRTSDPGLVDAAYFSVEDSGNGIDKISRVYFFDDDPNTIGDPQLCTANRPGDFPMEPIESGDITVRH